MIKDNLLHRTDAQLMADYASLELTLKELSLAADDAESGDELRAIQTDSRDAANQWDETRYSLTLRGYKWSFEKKEWMKS